VKLLIDVNLSPNWVAYLRDHQFEAIHWSTVGALDAPDANIMAHARQGGLVVFTHDLDFGHLLAHTRGTGPSVVQVRAVNLLPDSLGRLVLEALRRFGAELEQGALVTVDETKARVRILPIR
jgi:predicted nuclease of predicted toxin-antitoxin system